MSDVAGTPAPAEGGVVIDTNAPTIPNPANTHNIPSDGNEVSRGQPPSGEKQKSIEDSLERAFKKAEAKPEAKTEVPSSKADKAEPKTKDAPAKPPERDRGEHGRFVSSQPQEAAASPDQQPAPDQSDYSQPPRNANFSKEATAEWANTPESVRTEVHHRIRDLEAGHYKYKQDAEAYHEVRDFGELAKATGTTLPKALANYVTIERQLASDDPAEKWEGIQRVLKRADVDPRQLASAILNQPLPPQEQQQSDLNQRLQAYERKIAQLEQAQQQQIQTQQFNEINGSVKEFARERPRFDELSLEIASYLNGKNNRGIHIDPHRQLPAEQRLQLAYNLAEEHNPSASRSSPLVPENRPANGAGTKSIAGSPANGSDPSLPAKKGKHPTVDESIDRAFAKFGL